MISAKIKLPVYVTTVEPLKTGADRICIASAGYEYYKKKKNVIVVGLGTANTFDVILKRRGIYRGTYCCRNRYFF